MPSVSTDDRLASAAPAPRAPGGEATASGTADAAFVESTYPGIYAWFRGHVACDELAADLTQTTYAAFWHSVAERTPTDPRRASRAWLYAIARNVWRRHVRDDAVARRHADQQVASGDSTDSSPLASDHDEHVRRALRALPPAYHDVLTLRYWSDLSYAEIATVLRIPAALARWRVHRALRMLRQRLPQEIDV